LGLCLGFSALSAMEVLYYISVRAIWRYCRQHQVFVCCTGNKYQKDEEHQTGAGLSSVCISFRVFWCVTIFFGILLSGLLCYFVIAHQNRDSNSFEDTMPPRFPQSLPIEKERKPFSETPFPAAVTLCSPNQVWLYPPMSNCKDVTSPHKQVKSLCIVIFFYSL